MNRLLRKILVSSLVLGLVGCQQTSTIQAADPASSKTPDASTHSSLETISPADAPFIHEVETACLPIEIRVPAPWNADIREYSGAAIAGDYLYLLPQYPGRVTLPEGKGGILRIKLATLAAWLEGNKEQPVAVEGLRFDDAGLSISIRGFEGFESLVFAGERVYLSIESRAGNRMQGYLVGGNLDEDKASIILDPDILANLDAQNNAMNASDEAMLLIPGGLLTFFEQYGPSQNTAAYVRAISLPGLEEKKLEMPSVNFRITDAAPGQGEGQFWLLNYFYPGDTHLLPDKTQAPDISDPPDFDPEVSFARILGMSLEEGGLTQDPTRVINILPPIPGEAFNWEGLAYWPEKGFLIVTDSFPRTYLGFCPK